MGSRIQVLVSGTFNFRRRDKVSNNSRPLVTNSSVSRSEQLIDKKKAKIIRTSNYQLHLINPPKPIERELDETICKDVEKYKNISFFERNEGDSVEGEVNIESGYGPKESISFFESFVLALKPGSDDNFFIVSNVLKITQKGEEVILKQTSGQQN